jgi:general secretion pathway protein M
MAGLATRLLIRNPAIDVLIYIIVVAGLAFATWTALAGLREGYAALESAQSLLDQIEGRKRPAAGIAAGSVMPGSPFLEGQTVTVAGAALQQRVGAAVRAVGGNVLSSQIDLQGTDSKKGFVSLTASCEVDQPALQQLLYDLEAGMPFLFVDQLTVQAPQAQGATETARMRVLIGVSGQWQGAK